eukprot:487412_1
MALIDEHINISNINRMNSNTDAPTSSFKKTICKHSKSIRIGLVSSILLLWASLMIPYDIYGSLILGEYVWDHNMFLASLYIWLIAHICVILCSISSLITLKYWQHTQWIPNAQLLLIMSATALQIIGSVLFAYSYCVNLTSSRTDTLWGSCVAKSHGLYLLYNSGFIMYLGFIIFADRFHGALPIFALHLCTQYDDNPLTFSLNFRITYLSCVSLIGMILILVYGFDIYDSVDASYQAIYVGDVFLLFGTFMVLVTQIIFHTRCVQDTASSSDMSSDLSITPGSVSVTSAKSIQNKENEKAKKNCEYVLHLAVFFLLFAGILLTFMYSVVSKITEARAV